MELSAPNPGAARVDPAAAAAAAAAAAGFASASTAPSASPSSSSAPPPTPPAARSAAGAASSSGPSVAHAVCHSIVLELVARVGDGACVESTLLTTVKHGVSSASANCADFVQCAGVLFPDATAAHARMRNMVITISVLSKVASEELLSKPSVGTVVRRAAALDALMRIVESSGAIAQHSTKMMLVIRRFVVTAIVANMSGPSLQLEKIFVLVLRLITVLWQRFRTGLKIELAVLWKELLARLMASDATGELRQIALLKQLAMWCQVGGNTVDLFLNFDNDHRMAGCSLLRELAESMSALAHTSADDARATTREGGDADDDAGLPDVTKWKASSAADSLRQLQSKRRLQALKSLSRLLRSFMDASATVHLMGSDKRVAETAMSSGWADDDLVHSDFNLGDAVLRGGGGEAPPPPRKGGDEPWPSSAAGRRSRGDSGSGAAVASQTPGGSGGTPPALESDLSTEMSMDTPGRNGHRMSYSMVRIQHAHKEQKKKELFFAVAMAEKKDSLVKPIQYLCDTRFIRHSSPAAVSTFLREYSSSFPKNLIGDYLGELGKTAERQDWMDALRRAYIGGLPFRHLAFCEACVKSALLSPPRGAQCPLLPNADPPSLLR